MMAMEFSEFVMEPKLPEMKHLSRLSSHSCPVHSLCMRIGASARCVALPFLAYTALTDIAQSA